MESDFQRIIFRGETLVTVDVLYILPDFQHICNSFIWQTLDLSPKYPRVHRFLDFWRKEIDAKIKQVIISEASSRIPNQKWRNGIILNLD